MKHRILLVAVAGCLSAAAVAGVISANPTSTASTGPSQAVAAQPLVLLGSYYLAHDSQVPANGLPQRSDDLYAYEADTSYAVEAVSATVTFQGVTGGVCTGLSPTRYSVTPILLPSGDLPDGPAGLKVGELSVTIPPTVFPGCVIGGAIVTVTFQAVGGTDF